MSERVEELCDAGKSQPLRSTTGSHAALVELVSRVESLEAAIREVALAVEQLASRTVPSGV